MRYSLTFLFILLSTNSYSIFGRLGYHLSRQDNLSIDWYSFFGGHVQMFLFWVGVIMIGVSFAIHLFFDVGGEHKEDEPYSVRKFANGLIFGGIGLFILIGFLKIFF